MRAFASRSSDSGTTASSAPRLDIVPSSESRFHRKRRLGDSRYILATCEMLLPGRAASSTKLLYSSTEKRRRERPRSGASRTSTSGSGVFSTRAIVTSYV
jgi:hypothetical protein